MEKSSYLCGFRERALWLLRPAAARGSDGPRRGLSSSSSEAHGRAGSLRLARRVAPPSRQEQRFQVARRPGDGRVDPPFDLEPELGGKRGDPLDRAAPLLLVAHHPALSDLAAAHLELRLDERQERARGLEER